jgi:hypothetical protein
VLLPKPQDHLQACKVLIRACFACGWLEGVSNVFMYLLLGDVTFGDVWSRLDNNSEHTYDIVPIVGVDSRCRQSA